MYDIFKCEHSFCQCTVVDNDNDVVLSDSVVDVAEISAYSELYAYAVEGGYIYFDESTDSAVTLGDINGDNKITSYDATQALLCASGLKDLTDEQKTAADINGDGNITSYDATRILLMASGLV